MGKSLIGILRVAVWELGLFENVEMIFTWNSKEGICMHYWALSVGKVGIDVNRIDDFCIMNHVQYFSHLTEKLPWNNFIHHCFGYIGA